MFVTHIFMYAFRHYFQLRESIWNPYTLHSLYHLQRMCNQNYICYDYGMYRPHTFIVEYKVYSM